MAEFTREEITFSFQFSLENQFNYLQSIEPKPRMHQYKYWTLQRTFHSHNETKCLPNWTTHLVTVDKVFRIHNTNNVLIGIMSLPCAISNINLNLNILCLFRLRFDLLYIENMSSTGMINLVDSSRKLPRIHFKYKGSS